MAQGGDPHAGVVAVVEDDPDVRDLLDVCLTAEGYRTILLVESSQALAVIQRELPHLIILDIWLEQPASGWWLLRALQQDPATRTIPVLVYSAHAFLLAEMAQIFQAPHSYTKSMGGSAARPLDGLAGLGDAYAVWPIGTKIVPPCDGDRSR